MIEILAGAATVAVPVIGWLLKGLISNIHNQIKELDNKLSALTAAFNQHLQDDARVATIVEGLKPQLEKVDGKLDKLISGEIGN